MAFITKGKRRYYVRHGITGQVVGTHRNKKNAVKERNKLHRKFKPKRRNRGARARSRYRNRMRR